MVSKPWPRGKYQDKFINLNCVLVYPRSHAVKVTKMVGALAVGKTAPPKTKASDVRSAAKPPKGLFGGRVAERGKQILDRPPGVNDNTTQSPGQNVSGNERPTIVPSGRKAEQVQKIIAQEKEIYNQEKPTYKPGSSSTPETESKMLSSDSEEFKSTNSFAPPPLPSIVADIQFKFDDVEVTVEDSPAPVTIRPSRITPTGGMWAIEEDLPMAVGE